MSKYTVLRNLEHRVRSSIQYAKWVNRNKAPFCLRCGTTENLECHHTTELYHVFLGLWNMYGDEEAIFRHVLAQHEDERCDSVTLCTECHKKRHPARIAAKQLQPVHVDNWTAAPRNMPLPLALTETPGCIGPSAFRLMLGLGWYILNGHLDARMVNFHRRRLAKLLGRPPGTSFNKSLDASLLELIRGGILLASHMKGNNVEVHLSPEYLQLLGTNPWFMPLNDARTGKPTSLALQWFLGMQSNRRTYSISLDKLKVHIGLSTKHKPMAAKQVKDACKKTGWAKVAIEDGICRFTLIRRGATPIFSLRQVLNDAIIQGN